MAQPRCIHLTAEQAEELQRVRDHHKKAYMRERAAAILKVASGLSMLQVALHGLHKPRRYETISEWISRYECGGVEGLRVQAGRGRKPAFSPCASPTRRRASHR